jgi:hypothetical protein
MPEYDPLNADADPFRPPAIPTLVACIHCGQEYDSYQIEWRVEPDADGRPHGFWCCPVAGCDGRGFGFDILPVDPHYRDERGGWVGDGEEAAEEDEEESPDGSAADRGPEQPNDEESLPW